MKLISYNLEQQLFYELDQSKESIMIISPYLSLNTAEKLTNLLKNKNIKCTVITRFDRSLFINGGSSIEALELLYKTGVEILALQNLHTKLYVIDNKIYLTGSANFTNKGLTTNKELLILFNEETEILPFLNYANKLYSDIINSSNYYVDEKLINKEIELKKNQKPVEQDPRMNFTWGAKLSTNNVDTIVLSVSAGGTYDLVEEFAIHAHPNTSNYSYKKTEYITFRKRNGGHMDTIYKIIDTFSINVPNWKVEIDKLNFSENVIERISNYIIKRTSGFTFEKDEPYKFYILEKMYDLPNNPRPPKNNPGGWYYQLEDLLNAVDTVNTIK